MLEREADVARLSALLDAIHDGIGCCAVIEGPAGIGKTALLGTTVERSRERGLAVLAAAGDHLERDFPFGVVRALFEPVLVHAGEDACGELLAGAARLAVAPLGLDGRVPIVQPGADTTAAALHGLYWLTANMAAQAPIVIAVDDAHWADAASLRFLAYLARRVEELPVALVACVRRGESSSSDELLASIRASAVVVRPRALTIEATASVIAAAAGSEPDAEFTSACRRATGGIPFLVHQLARALVESGIAPTADAADRVQRFGPRTVARALLLRLARLPPSAAALAQAVAVLGSGVSLSVAAALAGIDLALATDATDALARAEIFRAAPTVGFVHPIVQAAIYEDIGFARRAECHRQAAQLLERTSAEPARVATHLLASEPGGDPAAARTLLSAGRDARARGAADAAIGFLRRALDEPPPPELRHDVLLELGIAEAAAMQLPAAVEHLQRAIATTSDPVSQARVAQVLTPVLFSTAGARDAVALIDTVSGRLAGADRELSEMLEAQLIIVARVELGARLAVRDRISLEPPRPLGDRLVDRAILSNIVVESVMAARPAAQIGDLAARALAGGLAASGELGVMPSVFLATIRGLTMIDRFELADELLAEVLDDARAQGSQLSFATASAFRSELAYRRGRLGDARAEAEAALDIALETGWPIGLPGCVAYFIDAALEVGELSACEELLGRCGLDGDLPPIVTSNLLLDSRGRLRLAAGDVAGGTEDLAECGRRQDSWGDRVSIHWRSSLALAWARLDKVAEARSLAAEELAIARSFGAPRALGVALRAGGLVESGEQRLALLGEAVAVLETSGAALEHARALTDLGAERRRQGMRRSAREPLRRALEIASRCGATLLAERARQELAASGARPRRPLLSERDALTASERRIADMAAAAMSNRDIAQSLFVTVRTVETHLSHIYQKLGVQGRTDLSAALADSAAR